MLKQDYKDDITREKASQLVLKVLSKTMNNTSLISDKLELAEVFLSSGKVKYQVSSPESLSKLLVSLGLTQRAAEASWITVILIQTYVSGLVWDLTRTWCVVLIWYNCYFYVRSSELFLFMYWIPLWFICSFLGLSVWANSSVDMLCLSMILRIFA